MLKGQAKILSDILLGIMTVVFVIMFLLFFSGRYFDISGTVKEDEMMRHALTLGNVILSSDKLAYADQNKIYRDMLDSNKIEKLSSDPSPLFNAISYEKSSYSLVIVDEESGKTWTVGNQMKVVQSFPVSIRYSGSEIHVGLMELGYTEGS